MGFGPSSPRVWPLRPDWGLHVVETLSWGTDVMHASATGTSSHVGYRIGPRRSFAFEVAAVGQQRRIADMLIAGHRGRWELPIWTDAQRLGAAAAAGAVFVPCATAGYDFSSGGRALLWAAPNQWQVLSIDTVEPGGLALSAALPAAWSAGTRLYPLRTARLQPGAEETHLSSNASRRALAFDIDEPSDWPQLAGLTMYKGHPVLAERPDESENPSSSYKRLLQTVDFDGALPFAYDVPDVALRASSSLWTLVGRPRHTWFRSLLYTLAGRCVPMWLPSWNDDLKGTAAVAGGSANLSVEWAGYTLFGLGRHNRRDLRIELDDGTALHRRVDAAVDAGATETLTLDEPLSTSAIVLGRIRRISIMALSTLASDTAEIEHKADQNGTATCTLGWETVVPDV